MTALKEKIGYGLGDMSTSIFWKIFSFYLPIFYSDVFGLPLTSAAMLMLVTRIWDAVSDPIMGIIADRTTTKSGKYRPYLLWMALPFALAGCLLFTTPGLSEGGKLIWAYATYILMMTVYTAINVPYSSMLAVITDDSDEKTVFSSYRMFFAYTGSFIALFIWEPLCNFFSKVADTAALQAGWQHAMMVLAACCVVVFAACFFLTRERVKPASKTTSVLADFKSLVRNKPWWIITAFALCVNLFNTVRGGTVAYYFKYYIGEGASISFGPYSFLFYAGLFLATGEVCNMIGVASAVPVSKMFGKRGVLISCSTVLAVLCAVFFYVPNSGGGFIIMLLLQVAISLLTGVVSPLIWSIYADVADYAEKKDGFSSAGLIFSSGSMAQKFGGALAGWGLILMLNLVGFVPNATVQAESALNGLLMAMSWIPALVALAMAACAFIYPLGRKSKMPKFSMAGAVIISLAASLSASAQDTKPVVSILGDSYSTFQGYVPEGNEIWYFSSSDTVRTDVDNVKQTWWWQLVEKGGFKLGENESYSGATISYRGYDGADYRARSFITRLPRAGSPDILLIFDATNDSWAGVPVGEYDFSLQAPDSLLYTFRPAMCRLASEAIDRYPGTQIYFVINSELRLEIVESIKTVCDHYALPYIQLENIDKKRGHPTRKGMKSIADQIGRRISKSKFDASDYANYKHYAATNNDLKKQEKGRCRVVLMGNSITDFWPERGGKLFREHPEIVGRGISGQTSWQFLLRFRKDVVELRPEVVVINYGTNDIAENSGPYDEDTTFGNICSMVDIARANSIKVVLASCLPAEGFSWHPQVKDAMDKIKSLNERVKAYAQKEKIPYVDYFSAMVSGDGRAMNPEYANETPAVHPNEKGYDVMAGILLKNFKKMR